MHSASICQKKFGFVRKSGILMPISSLPSPYGIGAFGKEAYDFVDFLHAAGQTCWQVLPLNPTSYGDRGKAHDDVAPQAKALSHKAGSYHRLR